MAVFTSLLPAVPPGLPPVTNQIGLVDVLDLLSGTQSLAPTSVTFTGGFLQLTLTPTAGTSFGQTAAGPTGTIGGIAIAVNAGTAEAPSFVPLATVTGLSVPLAGALQTLVDGEILALAAQFWGGDDVLIGNEVVELLLAGAGADSVMAAGGSDTVYAGAGNDTVAGGTGNDLLIGDAGADSLAGDAGADALFGGDGNDSLSGGSSGDVLDGAAGIDRLDGGTGNDTIRGGAGGDSIVGGSGRDQLEGGNSSDRMDGGIGADTLFGDDPNNNGVPALGHDSLSGGTENDLILGQSGNDSLAGDAGNDVLFGGAGNDRLNGGLGTDTLTGGTGNDSFIFATIADAAGDVITDFSAAEGDRISLSGIDANAGRNGNNGFTLVTTDPTALSGPGQVLLTAMHGGVLVQLFTDTVAGADGGFFVARTAQLSATDFIL
jgi:Ca2+-binding RTX toxin-like protein